MSPRTQPHPAARTRQPGAANATRGRPSLICALALLVAACSSGSGKGDDGANAGGNKEQVVLAVDTDTQGLDATAGVPFEVRCVAFETPVDAAGQPLGAASPDGGTDEPSDGGTDAAVLGTQVALPAPATVVIIDGPAGALQSSGTTLTFSRAGTYKLACRINMDDGTVLEDPIPAPLEVLAGLPASIETTLLGPDGTPDDALPFVQMKAGETTRVTCDGVDKWDNPLVDGWSVAVAPEAKPTPSGLNVELRQAGSYDIACVHSSIADDTPAPLEVVPNVPAHLFTLIDPPQITAGDAAQFACVATDAWGNTVQGFPFAIDHGAQLEPKGLWLSSTKAGLHELRCVPESLSWDLFTLHPATLEVEPAMAAKINVAAVPAKVVYKRKDKVQFVWTVRDVYDNVRPDDVVNMYVLSPEKGYKVLDTSNIRFNLDGTYVVRFGIDGLPELDVDKEILVDGAPPTVTIEYPPWGTALNQKPSIQVTGKAGDGDEGAGIKWLKVNEKTVYPDILGDWLMQYGCVHGLNTAFAEAEDLGGEYAKASRGWYYSADYYPTDASDPKGEMVTDGLQVFLGKDFIDDGVHDPNNPDDLATLMEVIIGGMDISSLLPPSLSQGDVDVQISNLKYGKPNIALQPVKGGIKTKVEMNNLSTDIKVKYKIEIGFIKTSVSVSGTISMSKIAIDTLLELEVNGGKTKAGTSNTNVAIDGLKLNVDGIAGLFDFLWNLILGSFKSTIEKEFEAVIEGEIGSLVGGLLDQFALNQTFELPELIPGMKPASITFVSELKKLQFSSIGGVVLMDASIVSTKGIAHELPGAIARAGCIGTVEDKFFIDESQRLQVALHDDIINQLLYAIWYAGSLNLTIGEDLLGDALAGGGMPLPLSDLVIDLDFLLPPILEGCYPDEKGDFQLQVGDLSAVVNANLGSPLTLGNFASLAVPASIVTGKDEVTGETTIGIAIAEDIFYMIELNSINPEFEAQKPVLEDLFLGLIEDQLKGGIPGLDALTFPLPALDLAGLSPMFPAGTKIELDIKGIDRKGGFTALNAGLK
jgi:hypothetical protein